MTYLPDAVDLDLVRHHLDQMVSCVNALCARENWGFASENIRFTGFVLKDFEGVIELMTAKLISNTDESTFQQRARALELTVDSFVTPNSQRKFGFPLECLTSTVKGDRTSYNMDRPALLSWFETHYRVHLETQKHLVLGHVVNPALLKP